MARYFKITEISGDEFASATGEDLDCCQLVVPTDEAVYVAIDEESEDYMEVSLDCFEGERPAKDVEYILEDVGVTSEGKVVSSGFYAGPNKKYADMFDRTIEQYAHRFDSYADAKSIADWLNRAGHHFLIREVSKSE